MIRTGADQCTVEATFELGDIDEINLLLEESGQELCDGNQLIIRRIISAAGSNRNFINGSATTLQTLKEVGGLIIDMHGPYDHQSLLKTDFQLRILDSFARTGRELDDWASRWGEHQKLLNRREELMAGGDDVESRLDMLRFQVSEIESAEIREGEEEELREEHTRAGNSQNILEQTDRACQALTDDEGAAFNALIQARQALTQLNGMLAEASDWSEEAEGIAVSLQELSRSIAATAQSVECDPARFQFLDERLSVYAQLKRKYGGSAESVLAHLETAQVQLSDLENREEKLAELDAEIARSEAALMKIGKTLHETRAGAALSLADSITTELRDLGFAQAEFTVNLTECPPCSTGVDMIEFGFAPNPGESMRPLRAIASSGEIARVMLATKAVLAKYDNIPVLVFDEIDSNVGGEIGTAIGARLGRVAAGHQVLCITHLPQVAVFGDHHYVVDKSVEDGRTSTTIDQLSADARVDEIARMLGGKDLTDVTLDHARKMLANVG